MGVVPPNILAHARNRLMHYRPDGAAGQSSDAIRAEADHQLAERRAASSVQPAASLAQDLVLYLGRRAGHSRCLDGHNERELLDAVRARLHPNFKLIVWDDEATHTWLADRELFASAAAVFGPHGGAFANILFCQPDTHVIEFIPKQNIQHPHKFVNLRGSFRPCYFGMSGAAGLSYWRVDAEDFGFDSPYMRVNVTQTLAALDYAGVLR